MKRGFHILCSGRNDTKPALATRHGKAGGGIQLKSAFAPDELWWYNQNVTWKRIIDPEPRTLGNLTRDSRGILAII